MLNRLAVPGASFIGGLAFGMFYRDELIAGGNLAVNRARRMAGLPATPKRDISSILAHSREIIDGMPMAVLATTHLEVSQVGYAEELDVDGLITIQQNGVMEPDARVILSSAADGDMIITFNTTKHSRKCQELQKNPHCSLTFVHRPYAAYVTMKGEAAPVPAVEAQSYWSDTMSKYYMNDREAFTIWKFVPEVIELVDMTHGMESTRKDWKPITLRRGSIDLPWSIESNGHDEAILADGQVLIR